MIIEIYTKTKTKKQQIIKLDKNIYKVCLISSAQKGKANKELFKQLSDYFNVNQNKISFISGGKAKHKIIKINKII